jgi:DNA-binding CsgD family transcriptional regulator
MAYNAAARSKKTRSDFSKRISECKTNYDILRLVREFAKAHGFDYFIIGRLGEAGECHLAAVSIISNWPTELIAAHDKADVLTKHPIAKGLRKSTKPIIWNIDIPNSGSPDHPKPEYYELYERFGIRNGVAIPVQQASGQRGVITLSGDREVPSETELMELSYFANLIYSRISEIKSDDKLQERAPLSTRERECLQWTACGKTSQEIAIILDLSEHTVNHYLSAACQKLGAVNRVHAVAKAIRSGILD